MPDRTRLSLMSQITLVALLVFALPALLCLGAGYSIQVTLSMIGTLLLLEYIAVVVFTPLDVPFWLSFLLALCVGLGSILGFYLIADTAAENSPRIKRYLDKAEKKAKSSEFFNKYAVYGLIPGILLLGVYLSSAVTVIAGWNRIKATALMAIGLIIAINLSFLITTGAIKGFEFILGHV